MRQLQARAEQSARIAQRRRLAAIAARIADEVASVTVEAGDESVALTAKRLKRRWLTDPALRFLAEGLQ